MSPRTCLAAIAIVVAVAASAPAQQKPETTIHKLRNVAAEDAAKALTAFADEKKLAVTVVAEPVSNSLVIAGDAAPHKLLVDALAKLDEAPPMVVAQVLVMEVRPGFAEDIGLSDGAQDKWVLTEREVRMFGAAVRRAKEKADVEILSRPQLQLTDNQTGNVMTAGGESQVTARVTPRVMPDGKVLLRVEAQVTTPAGVKGNNVQSVETTESVPDGGTVVVRGGKSKAAAGEARELLLVLTVHRVVSSAR